MNTDSKTQQLKATLTTLAEVWIRHHSDPLDFDAINHLADLVDREVSKQISLDRFAGTPLSGQESAVRQDAVQLLITGGFLAGNQRLDEASRREKLGRIEDELMRSISAAIRYSRMRLRRSLVQYRRRFQPLPDEWPSGDFDSDCVKKRAYLEHAIVSAAVSGKIRIRDQKILQAIVLDGEDPKQVAKNSGLSKSQIY